MMMLKAVSSSADVVIEKSPADDRSYRTFTLDNDLKVVVVSDPDADKAAVSLDVAVGSGTDPDEWPGMAHFLEHMLFLGTEKYPESGEYQAFIQQNGGHTNAFTAYDHTNYFYDIDPQHLHEGLDRFAQFFISPLFTEDLVERERNAVDSEYHARRTDDYRRTWSARKRVFNPAHPITRFSIGNNDTLADKPEKSVRDAMLDFYKTNYSSNIMTLAIIGRESLDTLEQWAVEMFKDIPDLGIEPFQAGVPLYQKDSLPRLLEVKPQKQKYSVTLSFALPETRTLFESKPLQYLSNLLGHEGEGSLLSYLKSKDLVESLSAGVEVNNPEATSFSINIKLTEKGFANWPDVVASAMNYMAMLRDKGIQQWQFKELQALLALDFEFMQKNESSDYAVMLSSSLQEFPQAQLLTAPYLMKKYDAGLIREFANLLVPENMVITLVSPTLDTDTTTPYYDAPYRISQLPEPVLEQLSQAAGDPGQFALPEKNPFVPENTALKAIEQEMDKPVLLVDSEGLQFYYQNDLEFGAPRASTFVSIRSPVAGVSPRSEVLAQLFTRTVREQLNEALYPATLTGLNLDVYSHLRGITIRINGYDDKQAVLLAMMLDSLLEPPDERIFAQKKLELIEKFNNEKFDTPYYRLYDQANDLLLQNNWPNSLLLAELDDIGIEDVRKFQQDFFKAIEVIGLSHGNVTEADAMAIADTLKSRLVDKHETVSVNHGQVVQLPPGSKTLVPVELEHQDAAIVMLKQAAGSSFKDKAVVYMLYQLLEAPFFHQLRTVEQLGYIVSASPFTSLNTPYIAFTIESPATDAGQIINRIYTFFNEFGSELATLDEATFEAARKGLITKINRKDDTLEDRSNRYWSEIDRENYDFDTRKKLIAAINELTLEQIIGDYQTAFIDPGYGELVTVAPGALAFDTAVAPLDMYDNVTDPVEFKRNAAYFD